jgi:hypothetical protein
MKKLIALLLASSLAGSGAPGGAQLPGSPVADYAATFKNADLGCCIIRDVFHKVPQKMAKGRASVGETAVWDAKDRALQMKLTAPATLQTDAAGNIKTPSMGIFGTGYCLGPGTSFTVKAGFQKPQRAVSTDSWSVTVVARTGDVPDTPDLGRLLVSLRVNNGLANLRVQEGLNNATTGGIPGAPKKDVTGDAYKEIYTLGEPFTLSLHVDRKTGSGTATLTTRTQTIPIDFTMGVFTKDSGPPLNVVGAALGNTGPKLTASVEVTDFELWAPLCPPAP